MNTRSKKLIGITFLSLSSLLIACQSNEHKESVNKQQNSQVSMVTLANMLTIQTVEFSSQKSVTNVAVALLDFETGEEISSSVVNDQGMAYFDAVIPNHPYSVVVYQIGRNGEWLEQTRDKFVYDLEHATIKIETFNANSKDGIAVPTVMQNPELPNGCEITSLTAILNYYGLNEDKMDLTKHYMPSVKVTKKGNQLYGPDPNVAYAGDPSKLNHGYYVFAPPIVEAANQALLDNKSSFKAMDLTNASREELIDYVKSGVPVLTWVTIDLKKPRTNGSWIVNGTNKKHLIYRNLHAVVLTGYENGKVTIMNPLKGYETIDADLFFKRYEELGSHAVVVL